MRHVQAGKGGKVRRGDRCVCIPVNLILCIFVCVGLCVCFWRPMCGCVKCVLNFVSFCGCFYVCLFFPFFYTLFYLVFYLFISCIWIFYDIEWMLFSGYLKRLINNSQYDSTLEWFHSMFYFVLFHKDSLYFFFYSAFKPLLSNTTKHCYFYYYYFNIPFSFSFFFKT